MVDRGEPSKIEWSTPAAFPLMPSQARLREQGEGLLSLGDGTAIIARIQ